jgi:hypothetical protein
MGLFRNLVFHMRFQAGQRRMVLSCCYHCRNGVLYGADISS